MTEFAMETVTHKVDEVGYVLWVREDRIEIGESGKPFVPSQKALAWVARRIERDLPGIILADKVDILAKRDLSTIFDPLSARFYRGNGSWQWQMPGRVGQRRIALGFRWRAVVDVPDEYRDVAREALNQPHDRIIRWATSTQSS